MPSTPTASWPVLKRYDANHLLRIALPLGGIGTGTISLGGRGNLHDFELVNRPAKGFTPANTFFVLHARQAGKPAVTRVLEGPIDPSLYEGAFGSTVPNHGYPRFRRAEFHAAYPLGQVLLSDAAVPVDVRLEAFNPLVPGDADASGIPIAVLRYVLTNKTNKAVTATVCGSMENFIGADGSNHQGQWSGARGYAHVMIGNRNERRKSGGCDGLFMSTTGTKPDMEQFGTLALATTANTGVTARQSWAKLNWGDSTLDFWDDLTDDGKLDDRDREDINNPTASLAVSVKIPPRQSKAVTFLLAWHFPNRMSWTPTKAGETVPVTVPGQADPNFIGNYYCMQYRDAWDVVEKTVPKLAALEKKTVEFVNAVRDSDLPPVVKEAALFNVSTLRTQTSFRTADGRFFGWEGCSDTGGCCHGSCTHVWNYEHASAYLFGDLALQARETEFVFATNDRGLMSFRVNLPLAKAQEWKLAAADGQMGTIMRLYRDWKLSGDMDTLRKIWPHAKRAMEFAWIPGGWDADKDGVMEGCQHNTMDVEYYGPNPQMGAWYLGALRAMEEMAKLVGDGEFATTCRDLFERGSAWMDAHLFNGEYYEHHVRGVKDSSQIAPGLRHDSMGARNLEDPELQLGAGCLVDQLAGQYMAHACGLGYLLNPANIRKTLASLMRFNFKKDFHSHFNHLRSFVLGDESAMLMATYPRGRRPKRPFPYFNEVMTGFEYTAAVHMLYEGMTADAMKVITAIRARYDGHRRSPFDEAECGHHYARAMASWGALLALTGFEYSAAEGVMRFNASRKKATWFWSNGRAWGTVEQAPGRRGTRVVLRVLCGELELRKFVLAGGGEKAWKEKINLRAGRHAVFTIY